MDRAGGFKRFYLYSALSIAVLAGSLAVAALLSRPLEYAGLALRPPSGEDLRRTISFAAAVLLFALPIGVVHYGLIRRSLADPVEAGADVRHFYLNAWVVFALLALMVLVAEIAQNLLSGSRDIATHTALTAIATTVGVSAWRWREATPARSREWESALGTFALVVVMLFAVFSLFAAIATFARMWQIHVPGTGGVSFDTSLQSLERDLRRSIAYTVAALVTWLVVIWWQRDVPATRVRRLSLVFGYLTGVAFLSFAVTSEVHLLLLGSVSTTGPWPFIAIGLLLTLAHGTVLWIDRSRGDVPQGHTAQQLAAVPALFGIAQLVAGVVMWWRLFAEVTLFGRRSSFGAAEQAASYTIVGFVLYAVSIFALWQASRHATRAEPRRFYVFTVVCLALLGTVVAGATTVYSALVPLLGVSEAGAHQRAVEWSVPTLIGAVLFVTHLAILRRDGRTEVPQVEIAPPPTDVLIDPVVTLLEDVRAGRVAVADAAARLRERL